jgi:hypothetical protein
MEYRDKTNDKVRINSSFLRIYQTTGDR